MIWSMYSTETRNWSVKLQQENVPSADFFFILNIDYKTYNGARFKCELFEVDRYHYHPSDYKKHVYSFNRYEKKYKFLLESEIRIVIIPDITAVSIWNNNGHGIWIAFIVFNIILGITIFYFIIKSAIKTTTERIRRDTIPYDTDQFDAVNSSEDDGTNFDLVKVEAPLSLSLNPVSSIELLRKKSKYKSVLKLVFKKALFHQLFG